jgi:hypothetical protein
MEPEGVLLTVSSLRNACLVRGIAPLRCHGPPLPWLLAAPLEDHVVQTGRVDGYARVSLVEQGAHTGADDGERVATTRLPPVRDDAAGTSGRNVKNSIK